MTPKSQMLCRISQFIFMLFSMFNKEYPFNSTEFLNEFADDFATKCRFVWLYAREAIMFPKERYIFCEKKTEDCIEQNCFSSQQILYTLSEYTFWKPLFSQLRNETDSLLLNSIIIGFVKSFVIQLIKCKRTIKGKKTCKTRLYITTYPNVYIS